MSTSSQPPESPRRATPEEWLYDWDSAIPRAAEDFTDPDFDAPEGGDRSRRHIRNFLNEMRLRGTYELYYPVFKYTSFGAAKKRGWRLRHEQDKYRHLWGLRPGEYLAVKTQKQNDELFLVYCALVYLGDPNGKPSKPSGTSTDRDV